MIALVKQNTLDYHLGRFLEGLSNNTVLGKLALPKQKTQKCLKDSQSLVPISIHTVRAWCMQSQTQVLFDCRQDTQEVSSCAEIATSPTQLNVTAAGINVTSNASAPGPATQKVTAKAAPAPSGYLFFGDGDVFGTGEGDWAYGSSKYAIPVFVVLLLVLLAGIGIFTVYWRRRKAANYHPFKEAELNNVQMHRSWFWGSFHSALLLCTDFTLDFLSVWMLTIKLESSLKWAIWPFKRSVSLKLGISKSAKRSLSTDGVEGVGPMLIGQTAKVLWMKRSQCCGIICP